MCTIVNCYISTRLEYAYLIWHMCIAVYCYLCILYYHVTITHDTTYIGNGDSNPGNGDVNNPLEEDTSGGGNICDNVLFEGKCINSHVAVCTRLYSSCPNISTNTYLCFTTFQLTIGAATTSPGMDNTAGSLTFSVEEEIRYSVRFEEGYDLYDERYESRLKINHPDVVSKTSTASSP